LWNFDILCLGPYKRTLRSRVGDGFKPASVEFGKDQTASILLDVKPQTTDLNIDRLQDVSCANHFFRGANSLCGFSREGAALEDVQRESFERLDRENTSIDKYPFWFTAISPQGTLWVSLLMSHVPKLRTRQPMCYYVVPVPAMDFRRQYHCRLTKASVTDQQAHQVIAYLCYILWSL
jgi:hypothetical protein